MGRPAPQGGAATERLILVCERVYSHLSRHCKGSPTSELGSGTLFRFYLRIIPEQVERLELPHTDEVVPSRAGSVAGGGRGPLP